LPLVGRVVDFVVVVVLGQPLANTTRRDATSMDAINFFTMTFLSV